MSKRKLATIIIVILLVLIGGSVLFYLYKNGRLGLFADILTRAKLATIDSENEWRQNATLGNVDVSGGVLKLKAAGK